MQQLKTKNIIRNGMIYLAKVNKKMSFDAKGILDLTNGVIKIEVEDMDNPLVLADLIKEFDGREVKITIAYGEEL